MKSFKECLGDKISFKKKPFDKKQRLILTGLCVLMAGVAFLAVWLPADADAEQPQEIREQMVQFSAAPGFYNEEICLRLSTEQEGEILYTLDGSLPDPENAQTRIFLPGGEIRLACGEKKEKVYSVRALLMQGDSAVSAVSTATYIIGKQVQERYDIPVLAICGAPEDLQDQETGILPKRGRKDRGRETEKAVHITLFDEQGNVNLSQNCGVRIHGGFSRMKNQPSLRLYARSEYDEKNHFNYALIQDLGQDNVMMNDYKRIIVRNSGNDNGYAHIRSEFASKLAQLAGFPDVQGASPVCVYLNGEYYGLYWFVTAYDKTYFERKYGSFEDEMVILEGVVAYMEISEEDDELTRELKEEYNALHERIAYESMEEEANWQLLNSTIDVENYLQYVAIQNYLCNADALQNNFKAYRYYSPAGNYRDGTVFDGKYRFLLFDLDETLGYGPAQSTLAEARILSTANRVEYDIFYNALFSNIVSTTAGREIYIRYYLALLNYYFSAEKAIPVLDEMCESSAAELRHMYNETDLMKGNKDTPKNVDYTHVIKEREEIRSFLRERPEWALADLEEAFGLEGKYGIRVHNPCEARISVDYACFQDKEYSGVYYSEVPVTVTAEPPFGYQFDYWLVDGVENYDKTLVIAGDMLRDDVLYLEYVASPDPDAGLFVTAVKSRGGNDYVALTNLGMRAQNLADYSLADGTGERNISTLPAVKVEPGEEIIVYCKNYTGAEAIGKPEAGFNIKTGETVCLYRKGRMLQKVKVPRLGTKDGVYRMDYRDGKFYEVTGNG